MERKQWFSNEVNRALKEIEGKCHTLHIARCLYIYNIVKDLMDLNSDWANCKNPQSRHLIETEIREIADELRNYKVFDKRYEEPLDSGQ